MSSDCSKEPKADKDDILREALFNARLWEAKFGAADKSRHEYRNNTRTLITQNDKLQGVVEQVRCAQSNLLHNPIFYLYLMTVIWPKILSDFRFRCRGIFCRYST